MPIDPNIPLQVQPLQIANPVDVQQRAMGIRSLMLQNQQSERALGDDQALRDAYKANITQGPDGAPTLNKQGFIAQLAQRNPVLAMAKQKEMAASDLEQSKAQAEQAEALQKKFPIMKTLMYQAPLSPNATQGQKDDYWAYVIKTGNQYDLPNHEKLPLQYPGDDFVRQMQSQVLSYEDQFKKKEFDQRERDIQTKREGNSVVKQGQNLQQTQQLLESARGNPAVGQAEKDIYAAKKLKSLVNLNGDPNNLNPQMVQLAATEVAKIASGGVPSDHELQGLNPSTISSALASAAQRFTNQPSPANQGAFLKEMEKYTGALERDAQGVIKDKYGRVIEARRKLLGEENYQALKGQYLDRFNEAAPSSAAGAHPQDDQAVQWAKQNPTDPRSVQILKLNGAGQ